MKKERQDKHFIKKPYYEGGVDAMRAFIRKHKKYTKEALEKKIEGVVVIKYMINASGKVIKTKVISGPGYGLDEEAERVVKLLKFKVPKNRSSKLKFQKNINVHFKMPKAKKLETKVQYQIKTTVKSKQKEAETKKNSSYHYVIKF